jgi:hypothetical protein
MERKKKGMQIDIRSAKEKHIDKMKELKVGMAEVDSKLCTMANSGKYDIIVSNNEAVYRNFWLKMKSGQGTGIKYYENGDIYKGELVKHYELGKGTMYYENGDKYEGDFYFGTRGCKWNESGKDTVNGQGIYTIANGDKYEGEWQNSKPHGYGIAYYEDGGIRYEGEWKNGFKSGKGTYHGETGNNLMSAIGISYPTSLPYKRESTVIHKGIFKVNHTGKSQYTGPSKKLSEKIIEYSKVQYYKEMKEAKKAAFREKKAMKAMQIDTSSVSKNLNNANKRQNQEEEKKSSR